MTKTIDQIATVEKVFESFENFDKWETYGIAFSAMDNGRIRLREIIAIANRYGISSAVVQMRRRQWLAMGAK